MLGKYIEVEYQDSDNSEKELEEFVSLVKITGTPAPLYGEIINEKYDTDIDFRVKFEEKLAKIIEEAK